MLPIPGSSPQEVDELAVKLLKLAKEKLIRDRHEAGPAHICVAVEASSADYGFQGAFIAASIQRSVVMRLQGHFTYKRWVEKHGYSPTFAELQEARHRWLDQLIKDFGG